MKNIGGLIIYLLIIVTITAFAEADAAISKDYIEKWQYSSISGGKNGNK